jgi:serine/threonine protein kinase
MNVQPSNNTSIDYVQYLKTHEITLLNLIDTKTQEVCFKHQFKKIPSASTLAKVLSLTSQEAPAPEPVQEAETQWTHIKKNGDIPESIFLTFHDDTIEMVISLKAPIGEGNFKKSSQAIKVTFFKNDIENPLVEAVAKKTIKIPDSFERAEAINEVVIQSSLIGLDGIVQLDQWGLFQGKPSNHKKNVPSDKMLIVEELYETDLSKATYLRSETIENLYPIVCDILKGLKNIHAHGIVHHDLKMENILIRKTNFEGNVVYTAGISDFGVSDFTGKPLDSSGTFLDLGPEMIKHILFGEDDLRKTDTSIDIWPTGIILYELLMRNQVNPCLKELKKHQLRLFKHSSMIIALEHRLNKMSVDDHGYETVRWEFKKIMKFMTYLEKDWRQAVKNFCEEKSNFKSIPFKRVIRAMLKEKPQERISAQKAYNTIARIISKN